MLHSGKFTQQCFLLPIDLLWDLKNNVQEQISRATASRIRHSAATNPHDFAGLSSWVNVVLSFSFQAWNLDVRAEYGLRVRNRDIADQILAIPLEKWMAGDVDLDKDVPRRPAVVAGFAFSTESKQHSRVDARRNRDVLGKRFLSPSVSVAVFTLLPNHRPFTAAGRAGGLHSKEALGLNNVSGSTAIVTFVGFRPRSGSRPCTGFAEFGPVKFDRLRAALRRLQQVDIDPRFDAFSLDRPASAATAPPASKAEPFKEITEYVEDVIDVVKAGSTTGSTSNTVVSETVVTGTLFIIAENVVGLRGFLETLDGGLVTRIAIRVVFDGQLLESFFDFIGRSITRHAEHFVVVALSGHDQAFRCVSRRFVPE